MSLSVLLSPSPPPPHHHSPEPGKPVFLHGPENDTRNIPIPPGPANPCSIVDLDLKTHFENPFENPFGIRAVAPFGTVRMHHFSAGWQHSNDEEKQIKASVVRFEAGSLD